MKSDLGHSERKKYMLRIQAIFLPAHARAMPPAII